MIILRQKEYATPLQKGIFGVLSGVSKGKSAVGKGVLEAKLGMRKLAMGGKRTPDQIQAVAERARKIQASKVPTQGAIKRSTIKVNNRITTAEGWQQNARDVKRGAVNAGAGVVRTGERMVNETGPMINSGISALIQNPGTAAGTIGGKAAMAMGDVTTPYTLIGGGVDGAVNLIPGAKMKKIQWRKGYQNSKFAKGLDNWSIGGSIRKITGKPQITAPQV